MNENLVDKLVASVAYLITVLNGVIEFNGVLEKGLNPLGSGQSNKVNGKCCSTVYILHADI